MNAIQRGFTLIEMAVAIFILALLLGGIMVPLRTSVESHQVDEANKAIDLAQSALLGFAAVNGYLPCPDKTTGLNANDGQEDVGGGGACDVKIGNLPTVTLGIDMRKDPWGNRYRYSVDDDFANHATPPTLTSPADIRICSASACDSTATILTDYDPAKPTETGKEAVAMIMSSGKNGLGAIGYDSAKSSPAPSTADEILNANATTTKFVSRTQSGTGSDLGEFDDIVAWLGKPTLFKTLIAVGKLP